MRSRKRGSATAVGRVELRWISRRRVNRLLENKNSATGIVVVGRFGLLRAGPGEYNGAHVMVFLNGQEQGHLTQDRQGPIWIDCRATARLKLRLHGIPLGDETHWEGQLAPGEKLVVKFRPARSWGDDRHAVQATRMNDR